MYYQPGEHVAEGEGGVILGVLDDDVEPGKDFRDVSNSVLKTDDENLQNNEEEKVCSQPNGENNVSSQINEENYVNTNPDGEDDDSESGEEEFTPSTWNRDLTPSRSLLKSPETKSVSS